MINLVVEKRPITDSCGGSTDHGNSTIFITCPFCNEETEAYIWSFSACGKKCESNGCDAWLTRFEGAFLRIAVTKNQLKIMQELERFIVANPDCDWKPSTRSLNALIEKGLVKYGKHNGGRSFELGFMLTDLGKKCLEN